MLMMCMHACASHTQNRTTTALQTCFCAHVQVKCNVSSLPHGIKGFDSLLLLDLNGNLDLHMKNGGEAILLGSNSLLDARQTPSIEGCKLHCQPAANAPKALLEHTKTNRQQDSILHLCMQLSVHQLCAAQSSTACSDMFSVAHGVVR
jgi:hypothetical protein